MLPLCEQVEASIGGRGLLSRGQRVLAAVSGGVDSMVLLHVLAGLAPVHGWKITVAHLNHCLRGTSGLADARLVQRTAQALGLPVKLGRADVRAWARQHQVSVEMAARELRHDFLARAARQDEISRIALAHHLDDQVELFFLRLFRGAGMRGLAGMKWRSPSPADRSVHLIRPLLDIGKSELLRYAAEQKIPFRRDASNEDLDIQRNRIRHQLLPLLEDKYQPELRSKIFRLMDVLGSESAFIHSLAEAWLARNLPDSAPFTETDSVDVAKTAKTALAGLPFEQLPVAVQRHCLQQQMIHLGIQPSYDLVERLRLQPRKYVAIRRQTPTAAGDTPGPNSDTGSAAQGCGAMREMSGAIRLIPVERYEFGAGSQMLDLRPGKGSIQWHEVELGWQVLPQRGTKRPAEKPGSEFFDADLVGFEVQIRHWQPGDRFQPIGMEKASKLQDLFINQKVPRADRRRLLVATTGAGEIFWVEGLRISDRFKLTEATIRRLHWRWQRL